MKLFYIAYVRMPTEKAHGVQIMKTCEALARSGVDVELVIPGRKTTISEDPFAFYGVEKNFVLTNLHTPDWVWLGKFGYMFGALWFAEVARWRKNFWQARIVYSRDALLLLQYLLLGRRLVYEAHTKPTWTSRAVARRASLVVVISDALRTVYIEAGVAAEKIIVASDACDLDFSHAPTQFDSRAKLGVSQNVKVALYVGRIDEEKGVETFARAATLVPSGMQLVVIGDGPLKHRLSIAYPQCLFLSSTSYLDLPNVLPAADILVIPNSAKFLDSSTYTSPMKLYAYLGARIPIVASRVSALTSVLGDNAMYFEPDDAESLAAALSGPQKAPRITSPSWDDRARAILSVLP